MANVIVGQRQLPARLAKLWDLLAAPRTHASLELTPSVVAAGVVRDGVVRAREDARVVGSLRNFQFSLHSVRSDAGGGDPEEVAIVEEMPVEKALELTSANIVYEGAWTDEGSAKLCLGDKPAEARFIADTARLSVTLLHCPWGGIVEIYVDDELMHAADTYEPYESVSREHILFDGLKAVRHTVRIVATGRHSPQSHAAQVRLLGIGLSGPETGSAAYRRQIGSEANALPARFLSLLSELGPDAMVLDCGGGRRQIDDPRYYNFEYDFSRYPDVLGDGHELPFRSGGFDLVLSQAVMEHMRDPFEAAREIIRVVRPGGLIYVESAFMQPAHCRPIHFFNTTIWGLLELFRETEILDKGHFGGLEDLNRWISLYIARANQEPAIVEALASLSRHLDQCATDDERQFFSTGVYLLARKR